jgi:hypothetical protein
MKVYDIIIDDDTMGVSAISLVEKPAVEYNFLVFSKDIHKMTFNVVNDEKRELFGVIMLADTPILRPENKKIGLPIHYIKFTKETIKEIVQKYSKNKLNDSVTLEHSIFTEGVYLFESYIIDRELGINPPNDFNEIPDGSWVGRFKIENDEVWNSIKNETFKGFSIEGAFKYNFNTEEDIDDEEFLREIYNYLKKLK